MRRAMPGVLIALLLLLALPAAPAAAQDAAPRPVEAGDRVRIVTRGKRVVGTVLEVADTLRLETARGRVQSPVGNGRTVERSLGPRSRPEGFLRGAGVGLLAGAASGAIMGFVSGDDPPPPSPCYSVFQNCDTSTARDKALGGAVLFGVTSAVVGGVMGLLSPGEHWERARIEPPVRAGIQVAPDGVGLVLSFSTP